MSLLAGGMRWWIPAASAAPKTLERCSLRLGQLARGEQITNIHRLRVEFYLHPRRGLYLRDSLFSRGVLSAQANSY